MSAQPRVTIGMPVYQGERFVDEAISSIRAQTHTDFELIIADNGSTDNTETICGRHVTEDSRLSYHRSSVNRGASWNFNRLVDLARGEYFKWASHDDLLGPKYLERCVQFLDADPGVVLCHTGAATIDEASKETRVWPPNPNAMAGTPVRRFADIVLREGPCFPVFGVTRLSVLKQTGLLGPYNGHDRPLLAELALHGRFLFIPDVLFFNREHPQRSIRAFKGARDRIAWFDPNMAGRVIYAMPRLFLEYHRAIVRSGVPKRHVLGAELTLGWWAVRNWRRFARSVLGGMRVLISRSVRRVKGQLLSA